MPIITNFYVMLGILLVAILILQAGNYSPMQKMVVLLVLSLALLWMEKPEWIAMVLRKAYSIF